MVGILYLLRPNKGQVTGRLPYASFLHYLLINSLNTRDINYPLKLDVTTPIP